MFIVAGDCGFGSDKKVERTSRVRDLWIINEFFYSPIDGVK